MDTPYSTENYSCYLIPTFHGVQSVKVLTNYEVHLELTLLINYILWQIQKIKAKNRTWWWTMIGKSVLSRYWFFSKLIYRFNTIPIKILAAYPMEIYKLKSTRKTKRTYNSHDNLEEQNGEFILPDTKIYYKVRVIKSG